MVYFIIVSLKQYTTRWRWTAEQKKRVTKVDDATETRIVWIQSEIKTPLLITGIEFLVSFTRTVLSSPFLGIENRKNFTCYVIERNIFGMGFNWSFQTNRVMRTNLSWNICDKFSMKKSFRFSTLFQYIFFI